MIKTIHATAEILMCLVGGIVTGFLAFWLTGLLWHSVSLFLGLAVGIGVFCWTLDHIFTINWDDGEESDDNEY